jgi:hypothetical protein
MTENTTKQARVLVAISRDDTEHGVYYYRASEVDALMAAQPVRDPLTDEQINAITREEFDLVAWRGTRELNQHVARAVERAHGIGGDK